MITKQLKNAFFFYLDIGVPLDKNASDLGQFYELLKTVDMRSIEFHLYRGDFEKWVDYRGESSLSKDIARLRRSGEKGELLRTKLCVAVNRYLP